MAHRSAACLLALVLLASCGEDRDRGRLDPGADSGTALDGGAMDGGGDAGAADAGEDAAIEDASVADAPIDAGIVVECDEATEVRQPGTALCWRLCPLEQSHDGSSCTGTVPTENWCDATGIDSGACSPETPGVSSCEEVLGAEYRLPTRTEIQSVLGNCDPRGAASYTCERCDLSPTCIAMFGTETGTYWASNGSGGNAYVANFGSGDVSLIASTGIYGVRCVRDGS